MECRDPGGWGDSTAAPVRTTGFGGAARVLSAHDAVANDVDSSLGCTAPNRKCSHFSWVRGHLALAGATSAGHPIRTRLGARASGPHGARASGPHGARASGPHGAVRGWIPSFGASARHRGVGFGTRPYRAVTGMIGETTGGERMHIAPGRAGILPSASGRNRFLAHLHTSVIYVYPITAFARKKR